MEDLKSIYLIGYILSFISGMYLILINKENENLELKECLMILSTSILSWFSFGMILALIILSKRLNKKHKKII